MKILDWLAQRKKAIAGFLAPGIALFIGDVATASRLPTVHQWQAIAAVCVLTAFGVHAAPKNKPKAAGAHR
jgi:hypothetical protein